MSMPPSRAVSASAIIFDTEAELDASPWTAEWRRPVRALSSRTTRDATSEDSWYWMQTVAPFIASAVAIAAPRLREDAVTNARLSPRNSRSSGSAAMAGCLQVSHHARTQVRGHSDQPVHKLTPPGFALGHRRPAIEGPHALQLGEEPQLRAAEGKLCGEDLDVEPSRAPVGQAFFFQKRLEDSRRLLRFEGLDMPQSARHHRRSGTSGRTSALILRTDCATLSRGTGRSATMSAPASISSEIQRAQCSPSPAAATRSTISSVTSSTARWPLKYSACSRAAISAGTPASRVSGLTPPAERYSATSGRTSSRAASFGAARAMNR